MAQLVRKLVSKSKKRYVDKEEEIDLDLSYVTTRIIAMGFPSEGSEAVYRNPLPMVLRFMKLRHGLDRVKVYNLCSERHYAKGTFPHALAGGGAAIQAALPRRASRRSLLLVQS